VDEAGHEPLEQLPLAQHDHRLVLDAVGRVAEAVDGLAEPDQRDEQLGTAVEERAADCERGGQRERSEGDVYGSALLRAAITTAPS
jgi:hypothetical protein